MVVGDHLDFLYGLPGPLAAGTYTIVVATIANGSGGTLLAEVDDVGGPDGGVVTPITSASFTLDGGFAQGQLINASSMVGAFPAQCGDILRLRISEPSGPPGSYFAEIQPVLTIP